MAAAVPVILGGTGGGAVGYGVASTLALGTVVRQLQRLLVQLWVRL